MDHRGISQPSLKSVACDTFFKDPPHCSLVTLIIKSRVKEIADQFQFQKPTSQLDRIADAAEQVLWEIMTAQYMASLERDAADATCDERTIPPTHVLAARILDRAYQPIHLPAGSLIPPPLSKLDG
mgnify:CR=1 FL=1